VQLNLGSGVHQLPAPIVFTLPIRSQDVCESVMSGCLWFDGVTWSSEGCNSTLIDLNANSTSDSTSTSLGVQCSCLHASTFSIFSVRTPQMHTITATDIVDISWSNISTRPFGLIFLSVLLTVLICSIIAAKVYERYAYAKAELQRKPMEDRLSLSQCGERSLWAAMQVRHAVLAIFWVSRTDPFDRASRCVALFTNQMVCVVV
jgi:hypothetical protein